MRYLFLLRQSPYSSSLAREALDMALATAAFDQHVQVAFINDGVFQLVNGQQADLEQRRNISKTLDALPLYDITDIFAEAESVQERGIQDNEIFKYAQIIDRLAIRNLIAQADKVITL